MPDFFKNFVITILVITPLFCTKTLPNKKHTQTSDTKNSDFTSDFKQDFYEVTDAVSDQTNEWHEVKNPEVHDEISYESCDFDIFDSGLISETDEAEGKSNTDFICNGTPKLCFKRYNEITFATTHNSMSTKDYGFFAPNQYYSITKQLNDGIRGLMLDTHYYENEVYLCHAYCSIGKLPLTDGLAEIRNFLENHPYEVVTIIFESYVSAKDTKKCFEESGLINYVYTHKKGEKWPFIFNMIAKNQRVVVFTDHDPYVYPWYHYIWDYAWDTEWDVKKPEDFSCNLKRGKIDNDLFILNHFLTNPLAMPSLAEQVNYNPFFINRVKKCMMEKGRKPNFIAVDFYSIGNIFDVVSYLNSEE